MLSHRDTEPQEMHDFISLGAIPRNHGMRSTTPTDVQKAKAQQLQFASQKRAGTEKFRFFAVLNAPTAMTEHVGDIPISCLNKGQCYSLSIVDTSRTSLLMETTARYRTCIRVSFDEDEQRRQPSECWRLWKQDRSTDEVYQGHDRTLAVEFSETHQPTLEEHRRSKVELEKASLDSFSVIWAPIGNTAAEVDIAVRFNFVSTDFSRSKGIRGAIVRICAKTHIISEDNYQPSFDATSELCFCKAKVFRDHGSKRKLSNDMTHVKKSIEKLRSGKKGVGSSAFNTMDDGGRLRKISRHRNSWYSPRAIANTAPEDRQSKLRALTAMLSSTRPNAVLNMRGQEEDDPDLYPLTVAAREDGSSIPSTSQQLPREQCRNYMISGATSKLPPSPSPLPLGLTGSGAAGARHAGTVKAHKDCSSQQQPKEAVACFYVTFQGEGKQRQPSFYQAIYLKQRTLCDFNGSLAIRFGIKLSEVRHTLRLIENGLEVEIDDNVVRELMEGQDMRLEIENVYQQPTPQITKDYEATESATAECESGSSTLSPRGVILRLEF